MLLFKAILLKLNCQLFSFKTVENRYFGSRTPEVIDFYFKSAIINNEFIEHLIFNFLVPPRRDRRN